MRIFIIILCYISLLASGCSEHHGHGDHASHQHDDGASHELSLNDGAKWQMDDHTRAMFLSMAEKANDAQGDIKALGTALQADLDKLIKGCTMTGAAHDELHKFLVLYIPAIKNLASKGGPEHLEKVKELLALYPEFFE